MNGLIAAFNTHVHVVSSPNTLIPVPQPKTPKPVTPLIKPSDIANKNITQ